MDKEKLVSARWEDPCWNETNNVSQFPSLYLHPQRKMQHKVRIFFEELRNLSIDMENSTSAINLDEGKFTSFEFEKLKETNSPNENNATNFNQLFSTDNFRMNASHNLFVLDGNTSFGIPRQGESEEVIYDRPKLLTYNEGKMTEQFVGWMSKSICDENGFFEKPVRIVYTFNNEQSIARWLIRSHRGEAPFDFSVCVYNANKEMIYKKVVRNNRDSDFILDVNRGLCKTIELRITRWHTSIGHRATNAKILYFYHNALFPEGATDYYSNDLLQNFSINEYIASGIGKANYGVQSNTGQFSLVNIDRYFHTLKFADFIKSGLKVQYFVKAEDIFNENEITDNEEEKKNPEEGWELLGTHYIRDIEFDEVRHVVKFKTQDRLIDFTNHKYAGLKNVIPKVNGAVNAMLTQMGSKQIFNDLMNRVKLSTKESIIRDNNLSLEKDYSYETDDEQETIENPREIIENSRLYKKTDEATKSMLAKIENGFIGEMSIWAALQKVCNVDLLHAYISRDDILIIDKIDQF